MPLNLIPDHKIRELKRLEIIRLARNYIWLISGLLVLITLAAWQSHWQLERINRTLELSLVSPVESKVRQVNSRLQAINQIQDGFIQWSAVLNQINSVIRPEISFDRLALDKQSLAVIISGKAARREDLLAFRDRLVNLVFIKNVDLPLENLLEKENVIFQITANLDPNALP